MKKILTILALMVATVATYGDTVEGTVVGTDGYEPNGNEFVESATIDWTTQKLVVSIDLTNCASESENILSVGNEIDGWSSNENSAIKAVAHIYYTSSSRLVRAYYIETNDRKSDEQITLDSGVTQITIEVSKDGGVKVNGTNLCSTLSESSALWDYSSIKVGSQEGSTRSKAKYNYIRVQDLVEETPSTTPTITVGTVPGTTALSSDDGYAPNGSKFAKSNISIDWDNQKLVASIDVSTCSSSTTNEDILSVGNCIGSWTGTGGRFHLYYTRSTKKVTLWYTDSGSANLKDAVVVSGDVFNVEISKSKGIYLNGEDFNNGNTVSTKFASLWDNDTISVGSQEGKTRSNATYNYIRVVDIDTEMPSENVTFAETESDAQTTLSTNKDKMLSSLTLTRTLTADAWNTFCVPFNITDISAFGAVKEFDSVNGSTMIFKDASTIEAGKPYLVKPAGSNIKNPKFVYATITSDTPETNVSNNSTYNFVGVYGQHTFTSDDASTSYILVSGGSLVNPTANTTMNGMRAYFTYTKTGSVAPRVLIDGVETALTEVVGNEEITDGRIYNLRGMYVGNDESRLAKGIYIKNGKIVVLN